MLAIIAKCLEEMVQERFGKEEWAKVLEKSHLSPNTTFLGTGEIADEQVEAMVRNTCEVLGVAPAQLGDAFKEYWANVFAPKICRAAFARGARSTFHGLDDTVVVMH